MIKYNKPYLNTLRIRQNLYIIHSNTLFNEMDERVYEKNKNNIIDIIDDKNLKEIHYVPDITSIIDFDKLDGFWFNDLLDLILVNNHRNYDFYIHLIGNSNRIKELKSLLTKRLFNLNNDINPSFKIKIVNEPFLYISTFKGLGMYTTIKNINYSTTLPAYLIAIKNTKFNIFRIDYIINPGEENYNFLNIINRYDGNDVYWNSFNNWGIYITAISNYNKKFWDKQGVYIRRLNIRELPYLPFKDFKIIGRDNYLKHTKRKKEK